MILPDLRCEYRVEPLGLDEPYPRFSWKLQAEERGRWQATYRVMVASDPSLLLPGEADLWDSGAIGSNKSSQIEYQGKGLSAGTRYFWSVEVREESGETARSESSWFETGMLGSPWGAEWIGLQRPQDVTDEFRPCPYLRRRFELEAPFQKARVYVTALGLYRLFINGARIGNDQLAPGWADYRKRIPYQTFDVSDHLNPGYNWIGIVLADGWYCGYLGTARERGMYGEFPQALLRLVVDDGREVVVTDGSWEGSFGPHLASDIYLGEIFDASKAVKGWTEPKSDPGEWQPVTISQGSSGRLTASPIQPVRPDAEFEPVEVRSIDKDTTLFDFGQNLAGWTKLTLDDADADSQIVVRHAEMLEGDGLYVENLRHAKATDVYTTGPGSQVLQPWFSYHGFRYAEVHHPDVSSDALGATSISARTPVDITGEFSCSNEDLNRLHDAILWSYRSNWLEVPTDCPNRDERLGWTGDATICANTACYLMDAGAFYSKWMIDMEDAKTADGLFTDVAPAVPPWTSRGAPGWGDGGVVVPWMLHRFYGDTRILERHLPSMRRWVDDVWANNLDLLWTREVGNNYGDWLEVGSYTIKEVISTCLFARSARIVAESCSAVGDSASSKIYADLSDAIGKEFRRAYVKDGRIAGDTQSSYVLALACGVLDEDSTRPAIERLVQLVHENGGRMSTGFLATEQLLPVLADNGFINEAYGLLEAHHFPSWLHFIDNGATTMWEHWDSWTPEGGFKNPFMNSFNHCSLGSVAKFLYEYVGGISPLGPGFKKFQIHPRPGGSLTHARIAFRSHMGQIVSEWRRYGDSFALNVEIPTNTQASVILPNGIIKESGHPVQKAEGLLSIDVSGEQTFLTLGGGSYFFHVGVVGV